MTAVVLMSREVLPENEQEAVQLMRELRIKAMHQPGYLRGETLSSLRKPGKNMVTSKWRTVEDWEGCKARGGRSWCPSWARFSPLRPRRRSTSRPRPRLRRGRGKSPANATGVRASSQAGDASPP